jgi:hypothetical protein
VIIFCNIHLHFYLVPDKLCSVAHGLNEEAFQLFDSMGMSGQKDGLVLVR